MVESSMSNLCDSGGMWLVETNAVLNKEVPPACTIVGIPARNGHHSGTQVDEPL